LIAELKEQTKTAIADIRRVVYDLRPPALDELGLVSAIREQAAQYSGERLWITVDAPDDLPPLPAAVEVAAYRIALEALMNVVRHSGAHRCSIQLWIQGSIQIEVTDDGHGLGAASRAGVGLAFNARARRRAWRIVRDYQHFRGRNTSARPVAVDG
jgi:signal transduction histidine kinase